MDSKHPVYKVLSPLASLLAFAESLRMSDSHQLLIESEINRILRLLGGPPAEPDDTPTARTWRFLKEAPDPDAAISIFDPSLGGVLGVVIERCPEPLREEVLRAERLVKGYYLKKILSRAELLRRQHYDCVCGEARLAAMWEPAQTFVRLTDPDLSTCWLEPRTMGWGTWIWGLIHSEEFTFPHPQRSWSDINKSVRPIWDLADRLARLLSLEYIGLELLVAGLALFKQGQVLTEVGIGRERVIRDLDDLVDPRGTLRSPVRLFGPLTGLTPLTPRAKEVLHCQTPEELLAALVAGGRPKPGQPETETGRYLCDELGLTPNRLERFRGA